MEIKEFSPIEEFRYGIRRWWIILLTVLVGSLIGLMVHFIKPPVYETKAVFSIHIDFAQTGVLTEFEQDYAINSAVYLMYSTSVLDLVEEDANELNIPKEALEIGRRVYFERKQSIIEIKVRNSDPNSAAQIANLWASHAFETLKEAHSHAIEAEMLRSYVKSLEACRILDAEELREEIISVAQRINNEHNKSRGIIPALVFDLLQTATVPSVPVALGRNSLMLAGALIGFTLGIILISFRIPK